MTFAGCAILLAYYLIITAAVACDWLALGLYGLAVIAPFVWTGVIGQGSLGTPRPAATTPPLIAAARLVLGYRIGRDGDD